MYGALITLETHLILSFKAAAASLDIMTLAGEKKLQGFRNEPPTIVTLNLRKGLELI